MKIEKYNIQELDKTEKNFDSRITKNRNWYEKSWGGVLNPLFVVGYGCVLIINQRVPDTFRFAICFVRNDRMSWFWDGRDIERIRKKILKIALSDPKQIRGWLGAWKRDWKRFLKVYNDLKKLNFRKLNDQKLFDWYIKLRNSYSIANSLPYLTDSFLSTGEKDWLVELIAKEVKNKVKNIELLNLINDLTATTHNSFAQEEQISLLSIAVKMAQLNKNKKHHAISQAIKKHATDFHWIENSYFHAPELDEEYFLEKVCKLCQGKDVLDEYKKQLNQSRKNKKTKDNLYKKLRISSRLKKIINLSEEFSKWQDTRKSGVFMANHFIFRFLDEMARRLKLTPNELYYTIDPELENIFLKKIFNRKQLRARKNKGCTFVYTNQGWKLFEGREYQKINRKIFFGELKNPKTIKGVSACPGKTKGVVRVVFKPTELNKIKRGEILVTNNTTPDFVPAMKRAAAVITEQGGITSHAAVISRELKIPCVIGTKIATKVLKDGDLVEVDANHGVVKILK